MTSWRSNHTSVGVGVASKAWFGIINLRRDLALIFNMGLFDAYGTSLERIANASYKMGNWF